MSNQILISSGAKLRDLDDVIIGTDGVLSSLGFNVANGVPKLDENGKILVSQLPNSVMEFKGVWNAATNTPTLANGTGNAGDVYLCNVAGTVNFGAGPITFAVGDYAVYTGSVWARSSGATGTVTSVGLSKDGDALAITGSPITTSGTINIGFTGTNLQYINGAGNLVTFPTIATEAQRLITEVYNETGATLTKGTIVYINGGHGNLPTVTKAIATGDPTSAQTYGIVQNDIGNMNNGFVVVSGSLTNLDTQAYPEGTQLYLSGTTAGAWTSTKPYAPVHLVYVAIVTRSHPTQGVVEVSIQNGYEMDELHNVAAQNPDNNDILQYKTSTSLWTKVAGTTTNIAEGTNQYFTNVRARAAISLTTTGSTGAATYDNSTGVLNIPNYADQYVGTVTSVGLSAPTGFSVSGSPVTSSGTLALSFASGYSLPTNVKQSNWDDAYTWVAAFPTQTGNSGKFLTTDGSTLSWATVIAGVQSVTASSPLFSSGGANPNITIQVANTSQNGYLSSTDWNTFNSKQSAITLTTTGTSGAATLVGSTLNIPNYSPDLSGYVTLTTAQTISGAKTFSSSGAAVTLSNAADIYLRILRGTVFNNIGIDATGAFYNTNSNHKFYVDSGTVTALTLSSTGAAAFGSSLSAGQITTTGSNSGFTINRRDTSGYAGGWYSPSGSILLDMIGVGTALSFASTTGVASFISSVGIGTTPNSSWGSIFASSVLQLGVYGSFIAGRSDSQEQIFIGTNAYYNGTNWIRVNATTSGRYYIAGGAHNFEVGASSTAGSIINYIRSMTLANSGNVLIGTESDAGYRLSVNGTAQFTGNSRTLNINTSTRVLDVIGTDNFYGVQITGGASVNASYGMLITAGTSTSDRSFLIQNKAGNTDYFLVRGDGQVVVGSGTQSNAKFAISAPNTHFSYGNGEGATFNIQPAALGQDGVNLNASYWTGTGYPFINFVAGGNNAFRITPTKEFWWYAEDNATARANIYYNLGANQYRVYSTNGSGVTSGIKIAQYNGTSYENVVTEARTLSINGVTYDLSANRSWTVGGGGTAAWPSLTGGARYGYDLQIRPATNSGNYGGFQFQTFGGANAGYLLTSSPDTSEVYTPNGITIVADLGWLTLAQRSTAGQGVRIMSGTSVPAVRMQVTTAGATSFNITSGGGSDSDRVRIVDSGNFIDFVSYVAGGAAYSNSIGMFVGGGKDMLLMVNEANIRFVTQGYSEKMRLFNNGNLVIGSTSDNGYRLQINGSASFAYGFLSVYRGSSSPNDILVGNDGSRFYIGGNTYVAGSVTATGGFFDTSDARLKTLIEDNYLLSSIANVKAKLYTKGGRKELGYYAQDLLEILPSAVSEGSDGFLSLSYAQVHTAKIAVMEDEVTMLKNRVSELEKQLNLN